MKYLWSENCVITSKTTREANPDAYPAVDAVDNPESATFKIENTKLYVPAVTLSTQDDNEFLEQLKTGFKRAIKCNKYRSEMTNQAKTNNLIYLIDSTFTKANRLFVVPFKITHLMLKLKTNVLIESKSFVGIPIKNKEETYEKIIKTS